MNDTSNLYQILHANETFLSQGTTLDSTPPKLPQRRMVVVTCMDTRLVGLLEPAMGIAQSDVKMVKVAGAQVEHPFGSGMRSILIAVHMLEADEVVVVAHHDCGMRSINAPAFVEKLLARGVRPEVISTVEHSGIDLARFLERFDDVYQNVRDTVSMIGNHPFMAGTGVPVHGLVIDPATGKLELVVDGYSQK